MFKARSGEIFNQGVCSWFVTMAVTNITKNRQKVPKTYSESRNIFLFEIIYDSDCA